MVKESIATLKKHTFCRRCEHSDILTGEVAEATTYTFGDTVGNQSNPIVIYIDSLPTDVSFIIFISSLENICFYLKLGG